MPGISFILYVLINVGSSHSNCYLLTDRGFRCYKFTINYGIWTAESSHIVERQVKDKSSQDKYQGKKVSK